MKNLILIATLLSLVSCKTERVEHDSSYFKIDEATSQSWTGGAAGSGTGINFTIKLMYSGNTSITIESIWIDGREYKPEVREFGKEGIIEGADVYCRYKEWTQPDTNEHFESPVKSSDSPKYDGAALLTYSVGDESYFLVLDSFKELEPLNYP